VKRYLLTAALVMTMTIGWSTIVARSEASTIASYVASGDPGLAPDANGQSVDVWTNTISATGGRGSGFFSPFSLSPTPWVLFTYPGPDVGSIQSSHTFDGGALAIGQTVLIDWANRAIDPGGSVGVSLTSGGVAVATVKFNGGDPDGVYRYDDAGGTNQSTGEGFAYQNMRTLQFKIDSATGYTAKFGSSTWTGTYSGVIDGIQVFNNLGGNGSDVPFNNLNVVPEPSTLILAALAGLCLVPRRRRMS
jgi:hypothetical protein